MRITESLLRVWLDILLRALQELAAKMFGLEDVELIRIHDEPPGEAVAAFISLAGDQISLSIGVASGAKSGQLLARSMLGMDDIEPDLPDQDVADAMGEVANILAGQFKTQMNSVDVTGLKLGAPVVKTGYLEMADPGVRQFADVRMGEAAITIMIIQHDTTEMLSRGCELRYSKT